MAENYQKTTLFVCRFLKKFAIFVLHFQNWPNTNLRETCC